MTESKAEPEQKVLVLSQAQADRLVELIGEDTKAGRELRYYLEHKHFSPEFVEEAGRMMFNDWNS